MIGAEFQRTYPGCTLDSSGPGEGDSDNVYMHLQYRCAGDTSPRKAVWLVQRVDGEWKVTRKDVPPNAG